MTVFEMQLSNISMIEAKLMGEKRDEKEVVFQVGLLTTTYYFDA